MRHHLAPLSHAVCEEMQTACLRWPCDNLSRSVTEFAKKANSVPSLGTLVASALPLSPPSLTRFARALRQTHPAANARHCAFRRALRAPAPFTLLAEVAWLTQGQAPRLFGGGLTPAPPAGSPPAARRAELPHVLQPSLSQGRRAAWHSVYASPPPSPTNAADRRNKKGKKPLLLF